MRTVHALASVLLTGTLLHLAACKDAPKSDPTPAASASAVVTDASPASAGDAGAAATGEAGAPTPIAPPRAMVRGAGHFSLLFAAARALEMKDDQKDKLDAVAKPFQGAGDARDETRAVHDELIAQVKAGKLDAAKLEPLYAALEKATKERRELELAGLDALYAALEPAQRTATVAAIRPRIAAHDAQAKASAPDGGAGGEGARIAERLGKMLTLDDTQRQKVEAAVPKDLHARSEADREERKKQLEALLTAFEKPAFAAKKLPAPDPKKARSSVQDQAKFLGQIVPQLKPEQREKLASSMSHGHGGPGSLGLWGGGPPGSSFGPHGMPMRRSPIGGGGARGDDL